MAEYLSARKSDGQKLKDMQFHLSAFWFLASWFVFRLISGLLICSDFIFRQYEFQFLTSQFLASTDASIPSWCFSVSVEYVECNVILLFQFMQFIKQLSDGSVNVKDNQVIVKNDVVISQKVNDTWSDEFLATSTSLSGNSWADEFNEKTDNAAFSDQYLQVDTFLSVSSVTRFTIIFW